MKYRLDSDHYWKGDLLLPAGTEVGDETAYPMRNADGKLNVAPSAQMTPLDKEAEDLTQRYAKAKGPSWGRPVDELPIQPEQTAAHAVGIHTPPASGSVPKNTGGVVPEGDGQPQKVGELAGTSMPGKSPSNPSGAPGQGPKPAQQNIPGQGPKK